MSETEQVLIDIWKELLGVETIGLDDNFFDVGGHSLLVLIMAKKIEQATGTRIAPVQLFRHTTIRSLAEYLSDDAREGKAARLVGQMQGRADRRGEYLNRMRLAKSAV